jgi:hypothetical protein
MIVEHGALRVLASVTRSDGEGEAKSAMHANARDPGIIDSGAVDS